MKNISTVLRKADQAVQRVRSILVFGKVSRTLESLSTDSPSKVPFIVYFADDPQLMYQLIQWVKPLNTLADQGIHITFVVKNPSVALELSTLTRSHILMTRSATEVEKYTADNDVRGVFYVNNSQSNFTALRMRSPAHIHLNHGESEKSSMVSNQLKAYDFCMIAGDAAEHRVLTHLKRFESSKLVKIGRPQLDIYGKTMAQPRATGRIRVLYAPTWEGDSKAMDYSSIATVGLRLVRELMADKRFELIFRPHPKTGTWSREAAKALKTIKVLIQAPKSHSKIGASHLDEDPDPCSSIFASDIVVADVSAITMDAIGLDRKLLLIDTAQDAEEPSRLRDVVTHIDESFNGSFSDLLFDLARAPISNDQLEYRNYVFGSKQLGTGTARFVDACSQILASTDEIV